MTAGADVLRQVLCSHWRLRVLVRLDGMNAVTIGADRRLPFSPCHRLAVDTLFEFLRHAAVTFSTRDWDIELENGRFGICRSQNFVGSVTVRANSGRLHAF